MTPEARSLEVMADEAASLLKVLAHPARLMICCHVRDNEMSVGDIETSLGIKQPRLSRELGKLRGAGFVETRRVSKVVFYKLTDTPRMRAMVDAVHAVMQDQPAAVLHTAAANPHPNPKGGYGVFARTLSQKQ